MKRIALSILALTAVSFSAHANQIRTRQSNLALLNRVTKQLGAQAKNLQITKESCRNIRGDTKVVYSSKLDKEFFFIVDGIEYGLTDDQFAIGPMGSNDDSKLIYLSSCN